MAYMIQIDTYIFSSYCAVNREMELPWHMKTKTFNKLMITDEVFGVIKYERIIVMNCNIVHNNNNTHIVMYTTVLCYTSMY